MSPRSIVVVGDSAADILPPDIPTAGYVGDTDDAVRRELFGYDRW